MFVFSEQVLGRVTDLRVTNVNGRRIRIAWTGVTGATGYKVFWRQGSSKCLCVCEFEDFELFQYFQSLAFLYLMEAFVFFLTGTERSRLLGAEAGTFTIDGLQPDEALVIGVAGIFDQRVGEAVTVSSRTKSNGGTVSGLRVADVTSQKIHIVWSPFNRATSYKIIWRRNNGKKS